MIRIMTRWCVLGVIVSAASSPAFAQVGLQLRPVSSVTAGSHGELYGTIHDDKGRPLAGAVVSALGSAKGRAPITDNRPVQSPP